jgi:hypothetical protein
MDGFKTRAPQKSWQSQFIYGGRIDSLNSVVMNPLIGPWKPFLFPSRPHGHGANFVALSLGIHSADARKLIDRVSGIPVPFDCALIIAGYVRYPVSANIDGGASVSVFSHSSTSSNHWTFGMLHRLGETPSILVQIWLTSGYYQNMSIDIIFSSNGLYSDVSMAHI